MIEESKLEEIKQFIIAKTKNNAKIFGDRLPTYADINGEYQFSDEGTWVGGFWTGINWLCYELTGEEKFADTARLAYKRLENRLNNNKESLDHDVGFLYILSALADYKLTGDERRKQDILVAAEEFMKRYNEKGKFLRAWPVWVPGDEFCENNKGRIIVDCMYNLPLLFWVGKNCGMESAYEIAKNHAITCAKYQVRDDYSCYHTYVFNHETGEPKFGQTCQGYADESCWSRGQAWIIGGFAYAYGYTKDKYFLEVSKQAADYFIKNLEEDLIPMWDFNFKGSITEERDTSAASIAASGFLELAKHLEKKEEASYYTEMAEKIILSLYENYSTKDMPKNQGFILHACGNKPEKSPDTDAPIIYGDYYFVETIAKLLNKTINYWI